MRKYFKEHGLSDIIALTALFVTLIFGYWGIKLSNLGLSQSKELASQEQQIKGFDSLLKMTNSEISYLSQQNSELSAQSKTLFNLFSITQQEQKILMRTNKLQKNAEINEFVDAFTNCDDKFGRLIFGCSINNDTITDSQKIKLLDGLQKDIESQFQNKYLLEDDTLQSKWLKFINQISSVRSTLKASLGEVQIVNVDVTGKVTDKTNLNAMNKFKKENFYHFTQSYFSNFFFPTLIKITKDKNMIYQRK